MRLRLGGLWFFEFGWFAFCFVFGLFAVFACLLCLLVVDLLLRVFVFGLICYFDHFLVCFVGFVWFCVVWCVVF